MVNILVVDDEEPVRKLLGRVLARQGYEFTMAPDTRTARELLSARTFELILCDVMMPGETGIDFVRDIAVRFPNTAIIMVTALDDPKVAEQAIDIGAYGYITKPFKPNEVLINVRNALRRRELEIAHLKFREDLELKVAERTAGLRKAMEGTIQTIALAIETRDPYTAGHQLRVADLACHMALTMGMEKDQIEGIRMAGLIHDFGKISVPAEILNKPGKLAKTEFMLIKDHARIGYDILKGIEFPWPIARIVLQHHERMNGSGYPQGLSEKDILPEARVISVADVVEAIASHRPYRPALGIETAVDEISKNSGKLYDSRAVDACVKLFGREGFQLEITQNRVFQ